MHITKPSLKAIQLKKTSWRLFKIRKREDAQLSLLMFFRGLRLLRWRVLSLMTSAEASQASTKIHNASVFSTKDKSSASDPEKLQKPTPKQYKKQRFKTKQNEKKINFKNNNLLKNYNSEFRIFKSNNLIFWGFSLDFQYCYVRFGARQLSSQFFSRSFHSCPSYLRGRCCGYFFAWRPVV